MPQSLNFGQLTYKQGMNTLVGAPVETFAKTASVLTDRYWKVRQGVSDTKNALSNLQVREEDRHIVKGVADNVSAKFAETSKSDNWHNAQGDLMDTVSEINAHDGLKLAMASKAANAKVDEEIDKADGWSANMKQLKKLENDQLDNAVKIDPMTGLYTGGYKGSGLAKHVNMTDVLAKYVAMSDKFNASSYTREQAFQAGAQVDMNMVGTHGGKTMTLSQFIATKTEGEKTLNKQDIADFIATGMSSDSELTESLNQEHRLEVLQSRLDTDDNGNIIRDQNKKAILKPVDDKLLVDAIKNVVTGPAALIQGAYSIDEAELLLKANPTNAEKAKQQELLAIYGMKSLAEVSSNPLVRDIYAQQTLAKTYGNIEDNGGQIDDHTKTSIYSQYRTNGEIINLATTVGNNIGYTETIQKLTLANGAGIDAMVTHNLKKLDDQRSINAEISISAPLSVTDLSSATKDMEATLTSVSTTLTRKTNDLAEIKKGNLDVLETYGVPKGSTDKDAIARATRALEADITKFTTEKADLEAQNSTNRLQLQEAIKLAKDNNIGAGYFAGLKYDYRAYMYHPTKLRDGLESGMTADEYAKQEGIKVTESFKSFYNNYQDDYHNHISKELNEKGMQLPTMSNLVAFVTDDSEMIQDGNLVLDGIARGNIAARNLSSNNPDVKYGDQPSNPEVNAKLGISSKNSKLTWIAGRGYGSKAGESIVKVDVLYGEGEFKKGTSAMALAGTVKNSYFIAVPNTAMNVDHLNNAISRAKDDIRNGKNVLRANRSLTLFQGQKAKLRSIEFMNHSQIADMPVNASENYGFNSDVLTDLPVTRSVDFKFGNVPVRIKKMPSGLFMASVLKPENLNELAYPVKDKQGRHIDDPTLESITGQREVDLSALGGILESIGQ